MKKFSTLLAILALTISAAFAKTYTIASGKWTDITAWNNDYPGNTINANDMVIITGQVTVNTNIVVEGTLTVEKGAGMVGMKDLVVSKNGKFINKGNTVMKNIMNEGFINNALIMEAMINVENHGTISNDNNLVAGNNFANYAGNALGNGGSYFVNNTIQNSSAAKFGNEVKVFYGNNIENQTSTSASSMNLDADIKSNTVVLSVCNPSKADVSLFSIEKSDDGKNYTLVDMVNKVNKGAGVAMTYTDNQVNNKLTFYRVKAINALGEETVLPVAAVKVP